MHGQSYGKTAVDDVPRLLDRSGYVVCDHVGKSFEVDGEPFPVLDKVKLSIADGEFVSLLGPSGCGKSTLLMMIGGLESISTGGITIDGRLVEGPDTKIGTMFQDPTLLPWKSALDNVLFPIKLMRRPRADYEARAYELLEMAGLTAAARKRPKQLSGGMRQRVAICRSLIHEPRLLLMDEPFSALDAITRDEMNVSLLKIWDHYKMTAIFVTHSIREAVFLSDRVLVMGGRPSTIISDVKIPFGHPRDFSIGETVEFNEICAFLRGRIGQAYAEHPAYADKH
jgi:NitT/TauT family transport system ATP-binding protein